MWMGQKLVLHHVFLGPKYVDGSFKYVDGSIYGSTWPN